MSVRKDILFNRIDEYDLEIRDGDFVIGRSDIQHIAHIMEACPGQYRKDPLLGVGVRKMLNGNVTGSEKRDIQVQLRSDGYFAKQVKYDDGKIYIRI